MKKTTTTNTNSRKERAEGLIKAVCKLLDWPEMKYKEYVYNTGVAYLRIYLDGDNYAIGVLETKTIFWQWWKNHFMKRDENFLLLHKNLPIRDLEIRRQLYEHYNEPAMLAANIHPNSVVLSETYAVMIQEVIATETQERHEQKV